MAQVERPLNMDLTERVANAASRGDVTAVRAWLAVGGSPNATLQLQIASGMTRPLLAFACSSSHRNCTSIVEILCAAGARDDEATHSLRGDGRDAGMCLMTAAFHGAVDTVRVLLRYGAPVRAAFPGGCTALHFAVKANNGSHLMGALDDWPMTREISMGHQGMVRLLLKHGSAVDARLSMERLTPLMFAARYSGFVSLGVVRELLASGADLDLVTANGHNAEAIARSQLQTEVYYDRGIPEDPLGCRRPGAVEAFLELCAGVRAAGSWKRYVNAPRIEMIVLQRLCEAGRASPPPVLTRLFPTPIWLSWRESHQIRTTASNQDSGVSTPLPKELVWLILKFWRTDRDP